MERERRKIGVALVGCGRISERHLTAFKDNSELCEALAVCDVIKERAEKAAEISGAKPYTSYQEMLEHPGIEVVFIATPSGTHPELGIAAARAGKHVVTEKPIGITLESVDELIKTCDDKNVRLFVIKQNRLNATMQLLKRAFEKGRFGKVYLAQVNVFWQRPQEYYEQAKWRGTWEFDGGAFMNQASHYIDALYWLLGDAESVMAYTATMARRIEAEDTGIAVIKFRNQAIASVNVTMLAYPKNFEGSITIIGEKGTVKIGGIALNRVEHWQFSDYDDDDKLILESNYNPPNIYGFGHTAYFKNVFDVLSGKAQPETHGRAGRKSLELILAIYRSSRDGKKISLPLNF
ncbi:MAG: O-antigen biosynthesis protein WlbA [Myxococcota bacterium]